MKSSSNWPSRNGLVHLVRRRMTVSWRFNYSTRPRSLLPSCWRNQLWRRSATRGRKIGGRAESLKDLPVETIHYDLSDAEKVCSACDHALHEMSHQTRKELKIVPAQVKVVEHVQHIYSCRHCEKHAIATPIVKAKMPNPVIPKGLASPSAITLS